MISHRCKSEMHPIPSGLCLWLKLSMAWLEGVLSTAQAYIADVSTSPQERTKNFGLIGVAAGIGLNFTVQAKQVQISD